MGVGSSHPAPSFPLRTEILAQGGSLLVLVCLMWVVLATCFCWPTYPTQSVLGVVACCLLGGGGSKKLENSLGDHLVSLHDDFSSG